jgi:hypothetical protein
MNRPFERILEWSLVDRRGELCGSIALSLDENSMWAGELALSVVMSSSTCPSCATVVAGCISCATVRGGEGDVGILGFSDILSLKDSDFRANLYSTPK